MMAGRPRLPVSTFGAITIQQVGPGIFRAITRFRDWDGQTRTVTATGPSRNAAQASLKAELAARLRASGSGDSLTASSPFLLLAEAWLEDVQWARSDRVILIAGSTLDQRLCHRCFTIPCRREPLPSRA